MGIINAHWYTINESINYPLDDSATCIDNDGNRLPSNILVDANIRWSRLYGNYLFLSSVTVNKNLVTLTFQVANSLSSTTFNPIGVLTLRQPVQENIHYPITPLVKNAGGWVVFGSGVKISADNANSYSGLFSSPQQSFFAPRAAFPYRPLAVKSLGVLHSLHFIENDIVRLRVTPPLYARVEERVINSINRKVIVIGLQQLHTQSDASQVVTGSNIISTGESVYELFAGPCRGRPESQNCPDGKVAIEAINSVTPDCDGEITLEFSGCALVGQVLAPNNNTIVLECDRGFDDICVGPALPDSSGNLPEDNIPYTPVDYYDVQGPSDIEPPISGGGDPPPPFPHLQCWPNCSVLDFSVRDGSWSTLNLTNNNDIDQWRSRCSSNNAPMCIYKSDSLSQRNVTVWDADVTAISRYLETHLKIINTNTSGAKLNGGIVLHCRPKFNNPQKLVYYYVTLDYDTKRLALRYFNGTQFNEIQYTLLPQLLINKWYELQVSVTPATGDNANIIITALSLEDSSVNVTLGPVSVYYPNPHTGKNGLGAMQSVAYFSYWYVDIIP